MSKPFEIETGYRIEVGIFIVIALVASAISYYVAGSAIEASLDNGVYHPWGYDSFYYAALIRDAVENYPQIKQFDDRLHPPEGGAWISFAWGYGFLMASIVKLVQVFDSSLPTITILVYISPVWAVINGLLLLAICRCLGFGLYATAVAAAAYALAPYVKSLHLIGNFDHHFIELFFILLIVLGFLNWLKKPDSVVASVTAGMALGLSIAFHVSLFVFYLPVALYFLVAWIRGALQPKSTLNYFLASILLASLACVAPSEYFQSFQFKYFLTSWFHLYWAVVFCCALLYLHHRSFSRVNLAILVAALIIAALPAIDSWRHGSSFLMAELPGFGQINETRSVFEYLLSGNYHLINQVYVYYSGLIYVVPFALILLFVQIWRSPTPEHIYIFCACLFGSIFLFMQTRFSYHGPYVLLLPVLILFQAKALDIRFAKTILAVMFAIAYLGPVQRLVEPQTLGGQPGYRQLLPFYQVIARQCKNHPGVLLAHPDEGHYLRYLTDCNIVSSNMLATEKDFEYRILALKMFDMPAAALIEQYQWVDYVYARREAGMGDGVSTHRYRELNRGIRNDLLLDNRLPDGSKSIASLDTTQGTFLRLLQTHDRW